MKTIEKFSEGRRYKFLLSSASLAPWSMISGTESWVLNLAKKAGFDGVEFFLFGKWTHDRVRKVKELAKQKNLVVHFHQVWSVSECSDDAAVKKSRLMYKLGLLPCEDYDLGSFVPYNASPVVAYADRCDYFPSGGDGSVWFQTLSTFKDGRKKISWDDFSRSVKSMELPVVLDTMHFLEFSLDKRGVNDLPQSADFIMNELKKYWKVFGPQTKEIHFNDFRPGIGDGGRNVLPGNGIAPLSSFANHVHDTGWSGYITPEINPKLPFRHSLLTLRMLREYMRMCWNE